VAPCSNRARQCCGVTVGRGILTGPSAWIGASRAALCGHDGEHRNSWTTNRSDTDRRTNTVARHRSSALSNAAPHPLECSLAEPCRTDRGDQKVRLRVAVVDQKAEGPSADLAHYFFGVFTCFGFRFSRPRLSLLTPAVCHESLKLLHDFKSAARGAYLRALRTSVSRSSPGGVWSPGYLSSVGGNCRRCVPLPESFPLQRLARCLPGAQGNLQSFETCLHD